MNVLELAVTLVLVGCHANAAPSMPSNTDTRAPTADFCGAMTASKDDDPTGTRTATGAMHDALVASGASEHADATKELVAWLHAQACVTTVEPEPALIDTEPPIRTIKIDVKVRDNTNKACTAELTLAPGAKLAMQCTSLIDI